MQIAKEKAEIHKRGYQGGIFGSLSFLNVQLSAHSCEIFGNVHVGSAFW